MIQYNGGVGVNDGKGSIDKGDHRSAASECGSGGERKRWWATMANNVVIDSDEGGDG